MTDAAGDGAEQASYELVIVSYRSRSQVQSLLNGLPERLPVALLDNSGDVDGLKSLAENRPNTRYLDGGGRGFAVAANRGARSSRHEHVVFVNPDCRPELGDLEALIETLDTTPSLASCAATMLGPDGTVQIGTGGWEPTLRRTMVHAVGLHKLLPESGLFARPRPYLPIRVEWTTGACMAVQVQRFLHLGGFDERYFVYAEDVAFARTARAAQLSQALRTDVLVPHAEGGSGAPTAEMMRLRGASMAQYLVRYNPSRRATLMRAGLAFGYLTRAAQTLAARDLPRARSHLSYTMGVLTGRASVAGVEVTGPVTSNA